LPLLEITDVSQAPPVEGLVASYVDSPAPGTRLDRTALEVSGWVLGTHSQPQEVEIAAGGEVVRRISVAVSRPDVAALHTGAPEVSGFWSLVGTLGLERRFSVSIRAVLGDGDLIEIGSVSGTRAPLASPYEPRLQPLLVTSLGRTGTTLLMNLLSAHPAIVAHRAYPFEIFPARYWLHLLRVLVEPADHRRSSHPSTFAEDIWSVGYNPFHTSPVIHASELADLLGRTYPERLAAFCQRSIDDFYATVAALQGQPSARYFAEKFQPDALPRIAWELYPETKEIVLVRDVRDLICSVLAFNGKRGTVDFGREAFKSDGEYVRYVGRRARQLLDAWKSRRERSELVRYEELAMEPRATLERILEYLELDCGSTIVDRMVRAALDHPGVQAHRTSPTVEDSIGRWRRDLPATLRPVVEESLDGVLTELGYTAR